MPELSKQYLTYVLVILVLILGFFYLKPELDRINSSETFGGGVLGVGGNADAPARDINYEEEFNKWRNAIKKDGPEKAYEDFKKEFAYDHFGIQHSAAHIFGEILFDETGVEGLTYCDSTFAFGCFHSFFGKALYVLGESVVPKIDQACLEKYGEFGTGCQHGIGHGLLQYVGFDRLVDALEFCSLTTQKIAIFGCTSGVFMENNVPLLTSEDGSFSTKSRELNRDNPYEPCDTMTYKFRESCYYEMGQWWNTVFDADYRVLGNLCGNLPDEEFKHSCFLGIGNVVSPSTNYDLEESKKLCLQMPSKEAERVCRSGASWSFFANPDYRELSPQMCQDLAEKERQECAKESDLIREGLNKL